MLFLWAIAVFMFNRITVKHVDTEVKKAGIPLPSWSESNGLAEVMYTIFIATNRAAKVSPINDEAVLRFARKKDRYLAIFNLLSASLFMFIAVINSFLSDS